MIFILAYNQYHGNKDTLGRGLKSGIMKISHTKSICMLILTMLKLYIVYTISLK